MRIPVFRSQARATTAAPGQSLNVRMQAQPFIQAELAKGNVITTAADTINAYATMRAEAEAKIQYNEALFAAEEEMRTLADSLKDSPRLGDVINEDGSGSWQTQVADMRDRLAEGMMSQSMTDAFNARFNQQELTVRFQLRDEIDRRIQARAAAAATARQNQLVAQLSDHRSSLELLPFLLTSQDEELKSSVAAGLISPEARVSVNAKIIEDIAKGVSTSYVGGDPSVAIKLARALELQDQVDSGVLSAQEAASLSGLGPDAEYALAVLALAPRNVALAALGDAITNANKIDAVLDEMRSEQQAFESAQNSETFNSIFGVDPNAPASTDLSDRLSQVAPGALAAAGLAPNQPITGKQYIDLATAFLDRRNSLTPQQRETITTHRTPTATGPFAQNDDPTVYAQLQMQATSGNLTTEMLNANQGALTVSTWTTLLNRISTEADESLNSVDDAVASAFKYNKVSGASDEASREAEAAYASVSTQLQNEFNTRRASGNPMTSTELNARADELVNARMVEYRASLQDNLTSYLEAQHGRWSNLGFPATTSGNELQQLDDWYNSLTEPTPQQTSVYAATRAEIARRISMIQGQ